MADAHKNFAYSTISTAPSPASSGTSLVVTAGHGTRFPAAPFNAVVCPANTAPTPENAEIVRVTNVSTDTFTIVRTQESTNARAINVGDSIFAGPTAKTFTDIEGTQSGGSKTLAVLNALQSQPPAVNFATFDTRNSIAVLDFDDAVLESTNFVFILPEGADLTSGIKVRIHWTATSATAGLCKWGVKFERMNTDVDSDNFDTATVDVGQAPAATNGQPSIVEITATNIDGLSAGDLCRLQIYRDAADGLDTMSGDAELIAIEVRSAA